MSNINIFQIPSKVRTEKPEEVKEAVSLSDAEKLHKVAMAVVTDETPVQYYKAVLSALLGVYTSANRICPKDSNVLLNSLYYARLGKKGNTSPQGLSYSDLEALLNQFIGWIAPIFSLNMDKKMKPTSSASSAPKTLSGRIEQAKQSKEQCKEQSKVKSASPDIKAIIKEALAEMMNGDDVSL